MAKEWHWEGMDLKDANGRLVLSADTVAVGAKPLFAALPDLLAALEAVEWDSDEEHDYCPWCLGWCGDSGHTDDCQRQAALAKAKGA